MSLGSGAGGSSVGESNRSSEGAGGGGGGGGRSEKSCPIFSNSANSFSVSVDSSADMYVLNIDTDFCYNNPKGPVDKPVSVQFSQIKVAHETQSRTIASSAIHNKIFSNQNLPISGL